MKRILEIHRDGKLIQWLDLAKFMPHYADCEFQLATCDDPERVYAQRRKREAITLEELGL